MKVFSQSNYRDGKNVDPRLRDTASCNVRPTSVTLDPCTWYGNCCETLLTNALKNQKNRLELKASLTVM